MKDEEIMDRVLREFDRFIETKGLEVNPEPPYITGFYDEDWERFKEKIKEKFEVK